LFAQMWSTEHLKAKVTVPENQLEVYWVNNSWKDWRIS